MPATTASTTQPARHTALPGMPRKPLDASKQIEALHRAQFQAENRIKLGLRLFKAAEAHTSTRRNILEDIKTDQQDLRDQLQSDMEESFHRYEHRLESIDDKVVKSIESLDKRISLLHEEFAAAESRIQTLLNCAEKLLKTSAGVSQPPAPAVSPAAPVAVNKPTAKAPVSAPDRQPAPKDSMIFTNVIRRLDEQKPGSSIPPQPSN